MKRLCIYNFTVCFPKSTILIQNVQNNYNKDTINMHPCDGTCTWEQENTNWVNTLANNGNESSTSSTSQHKFNTIL